MKNNKRYVYASLIIICAGLGGFFLPALLKQSTLIGIFIGLMTATLFIAISDPNFINESNKNLSEQRKKRLSKVQFHGFKRTILHPTRRHTYIGLLWAIIIFATLNFYNKVNLNSFNLVFVPFLLFMGSDGYQMIKRNEYINRHGNIAHGFPSRLFGFSILFLCWGMCILLILSQIFHW